MKALFFSPFSNIWEHSFPEALVAAGLHERGIDIVTVRCGGLYDSFCVAMSAAGLTAADTFHKRRQVCSACFRRRELVDSKFNFRSLITDDFLLPGDVEELDILVQSSTLENWPTLVLRNVPIGRYAAYEFLLNYKIMGTNIPEELFPIYREQLRNSAATLMAAERILDLERPDYVVTYNRLYGVNHAFLAVAELRGIPTYTLQGGSHITLRGETMSMFLESQTQFQVFGSHSWQEYRETPVGSSEISLVASHFEGLLEASSAFAYSSAFQASKPSHLRERFGIPAEAKVVLIPMSSEDELNAAQLANVLPDTTHRPNLFENQFEWIEFVFQYARTRPEVKFVLRLHPRMFPNKRESVVAPVVERVMELIETAPPNVIVNLPTDNISLYDLMQILDVVLGYRSSVGAELAAFGIPVVAPANRDFFTYPQEINRTAFTSEEFVIKLDAALEEGWSLENVRKAFRWYAFLFTRIASDFSGAVNAKPIAIRPKIPGFRLWLWRKMVFVIISYGPLVRERLALRNRETSRLSKDVFFDVMSHKRNSLAESTVWPKLTGSEQEESTLLQEHLTGLCEGMWKEIVEPNSLAGRIRIALGITSSN
ncbi:hypothetical protein [Alpinimonas psychrophila]|uniref:Capsule polysaccharide biosynthesis protein n=1 Tax=Alpinimonas psychrophila TaxID=748908 RepID=A0A7W3PPA2_9MICO|nr:hypothetical protein [Alpinimonas psychrophila]MBA8829260.1 hypothetical protein [Alpinimonas psychrophila]